MRARGNNSSTGELLLRPHKVLRVVKPPHEVGGSFSWLEVVRVLKLDSGLSTAPLSDLIAAEVAGVLASQRVVLLR